MKRLLFILASACLIISSCKPKEKDLHPEVVLMYMSSHNNGLSSFSERQMKDFQLSDLPLSTDNNKIFLVYAHLYGRSPILYRYAKDKKGRFVETIVKEYPASTISTKSSTIRSVLSDVEEVFKPVGRTLILSSHGSSFLPPYFQNSDDLLFDSAQRDAFGPDDDYSLDILELAAILRSFHFNLLMFDCCYMGSVELAYELRNCADYIIGSAHEVLGAGMFRGKMIAPLFSDKSWEEKSIEMCKIYMDYCRNDNSYVGSGFVGLVKSSEFGGLANESKKIFAAHRADIESLNLYTIQRYVGNADFKHLYDFGDFIEHIASTDELKSWNSAYKNCVIYKDQTAYFFDKPIRHHCGLNSYITKSWYDEVNKYYKKLAWNTATSFVE